MPEQYAAAFAVLARAMGFHARLAVGYTGGTHQADGSVSFTTRDLKVWPEVQLAGIGWLPLPADPSGSGSRSSHAPSPTPASTPLGDALHQQRQINQAPKPSPAPPAPGGLPAPVPVAPTDLPGWGWALLGIGAAVVSAVGAVLTGKSLRRRRQRQRRDPAAQLAGAWEHTLDRLAEYRLRLPASLTAPEVAERAGASVGRRAPPLNDLAVAVDAARYDRRQATASEAVERGWVAAGQVDAALRSAASLRGRVRVALSLAPFTRARART